MDQKLLDILACPLCKSRLYFDKTQQTLTCKPCHRVYPIRNGIPVLLADAGTDESATQETPETQESCT